MDEDNCERVVSKIYTVYGTDTGTLFGLQSHQRKIVSKIVELTMWILLEEEKKKNHTVEG